MNSKVFISNLQIVHYIYGNQIISSSNISARRKQKPPELPQVEGFQSEKMFSLENRRKSYIFKILYLISVRNRNSELSK